MSTNARARMLENPSDESVVRWGNDGDSFVVLEVCRCQIVDSRRIANSRAEREVHKAYSSQAFQAQQLRQFCPSVEQIRFPQSATQ